jgi:iron-sulfur cluster assembly accessory protein
MYGELNKLIIEDFWIVKMILSDLAKLKIKDLYKKDLEKILLFTINKTGCSGLEFIVKLTNNKEDYHIETHDDVIIALDKNFLEIFNKTKVDYLYSKFEEKFIFENENITSYCGCGKSFNL